MYIRHVAYLRTLGMVCEAFQRVTWDHLVYFGRLGQESARVGPVHSRLSCRTRRCRLHRVAEPTSPAYASCENEQDRLVPKLGPIRRNAPDDPKLKYTHCNASQSIPATENYLLSAPRMCLNLLIGSSRARSKSCCCCSSSSSSFRVCVCLILFISLFNWHRPICHRQPLHCIQLCIDCDGSRETRGQQGRVAACHCCAVFLCFGEGVRGCLCVCVWNVFVGVRFCLKGSVSVRTRRSRWQRGNADSRKIFACPPRAMLA